MTQKVNDLVSLYIQLREKKAVAKKAFDEKMKPVTEAMNDIEAKLIDLMNQTGVDSFKTEQGTAYKSRRTSAKVADWDMFIDYVMQNDAQELLERRASKAAVEEFRDAHDDLPPGISWSEEITVNFRK